MVARKPTIADVAREAGVSKGLVSFVFNDRPGVAPQTRDRIMQVAESLGWRPSVSGRLLSTRTSYAFGLVVRRDPQVIAADPFFPSFIAGVETVLATEGRVLVLSVVPDEEAELRTYRTLVADNRIDGVFLTDLRQDDSRPGLLRDLDIPAVMVGHPSTSSGFPVVSLDDAPGISQAVRHLVDLGHTRIAHVAGDQQLVHGIHRREAFVATMNDAGLDPSLVIETDFVAAAGAAATRTLINSAEPPTAIVFANDPMAIAGMSVLHESGLKVPDDVSVTGFDGTEMARYVYPALTTVSTDPVEWGRAAAQTLLTLMATGKADDLELPAAKLVLGASSATPRT